MSVKALKRQLIAAIAMVLVATIAMGSSTYAWFVSSGSVTAEGMKVQAQAESGLAISFDGNAWGTTAAANMTTEKALYPASTRDLAAWYHATAAATNAAAAADGTRTRITDTVFPGGTYAENSYVVMKTFKIRSTSADALSKGLYVKDVQVTGNKTMSTALRVGVSYTAVGATPVYKIFGPVSVGAGDSANKATDNYTVYSETGTSLGTVALTTPGNSAKLIEDNVTIPAAAGDAVTVNIFVWYEGEDANLFSDNYETETLSVSVVFENLA